MKDATADQDQLSMSLNLAEVIQKHIIQEESI